MGRKHSSLNLTTNVFGRFDMQLIKEKDLSQKLSVSIPKLRKERSNRSGIPFYKLNGSIRYALEDVMKYLQKNKHTKGVQDSP